MEFENRLPIGYLQQPHLGVSSARNFGLREDRSPIVLSLVDEVIPIPQLIAEFYTRARRPADEWR